MKPINRRQFIKNAATAGGVLAAGNVFATPAFIRDFVQKSPNDRVNVGVVGLSGTRPRVRAIPRGRGMQHIKGYARFPNVRVTTVCDVDERLLPHAVAETERLYGYTPKTEVDYRYCFKYNLTALALTGMGFFVIITNPTLSSWVSEI